MLTALRSGSPTIRLYAENLIFKSKEKKVTPCGSLKCRSENHGSLHIFLL
jgi:hypothetical protein